jgi:hypothetical protein
MLALVTLHIRQYVGFAVYSERMPATEMTERIGLEPDVVSIRGSRRQHPKSIPVSHMWAVECRTPNLRLDDQLDVLLRRLRPRENELRRLAEELEDTEGSAGAVLRFVRYLDDPDDPGGTADGWQHRLLGWHLNAEVLRFLASVHAEIDADEYGQALPWWQFRLRRQYQRVPADAVISSADTGVQVSGPGLED